LAYINSFEQVFGLKKHISASILHEETHFSKVFDINKHISASVWPIGGNELIPARKGGGREGGREREREKGAPFNAVGCGHPLPFPNAGSRPSPPSRDKRGRRRGGGREGG
jgi:hypothetical protein